MKFNVVIDVPPTRSRIFPKLGTVSAMNSSRAIIAVLYSSLHTLNSKSRTVKISGKDNQWGQNVSTYFLVFSISSHRID